MKKNIRAERLYKRAVNQSALQAVEFLNIRNSEVIADIGEGSGLLTFEFAKLTGSNGLVIAADTNTMLLEHIVYSL